mmetsp:Transcript_9084/g.17030  ORF Transcript_9084/g.17030 Transcript_9084/m.17030 type:complete len:303 (+) Transcript_9084:49-957(+)
MSEIVHEFEQASKNNSSPPAEVVPQKETAESVTTKDSAENEKVSKESAEIMVEEEGEAWTSINKMLCNNRCFICRQGFPRGKKKKVFMVSQILQSFTAIYATKDQSPPLSAPRQQSDKPQGESEGGQDKVSSRTAIGDGTDTSSSVSTTATDTATDTSENEKDVKIVREEGGQDGKEGGASNAWALDKDSGLDPRLILFINFKEQCPHVWACWQSFYSLAGSPEREQKLVDLLAEVDVQVWMSGLACCRSDMCAAMYRAITSDNSKNERIASILASKEKFTHKNTFCPPDCDCDSPWQFMNM